MVKINADEYFLCIGCVKIGIISSCIGNPPQNDDFMPLSQNLIGCSLLHEAAYYGDHVLPMHWRLIQAKSCVIKLWNWRIHYMTRLTSHMNALVWYNMPTSHPKMASWFWVALIMVKWGLYSLRKSGNNSNNSLIQFSLIYHTRQQTMETWFVVAVVTRNEGKRDPLLEKKVDIILTKWRRTHRVYLVVSVL